MKKFFPELLTFAVLLFVAINLQGQWSNGFLPHGRTGNSVCVINRSQVAFAGGHEANDSLQGLFWSNNRCVTIDIQRDSFKPWLKSIKYTDSLNAIAVGYHGSVVKTTNAGVTWTDVSTPGNMYFRHFHSLFFVTDSIGYIAGGWPGNDSIQTILKTVDAGNSWSILRDTFGFQLRNILFVNLDTGYAVGEHGTILKTANAGNNWAEITLTGNLLNRDFYNSYFFDADTGIVIGGNISNDSIQTIIKTTDGGSTWSILLDNLGPMLRGIDFSNADSGFIVGDKGVYLKSIDAGNSWAPLALPFSINDSTDLYAVDYLNPDFGVATGKFGKVLIFETPLSIPADVVTNTSEDITLTSAKVRGTVDPNNSPASVYFEYGISPAFGTTIAATPDSVFVDTLHEVSANLSGLLSNVLYYYRVKATNSGGETVGQTKSFYTADCVIPNCDFEVWDTVYTDVPAVWKHVGGVSKVASYDGSTAVELTYATMENAGAVIYGEVSEGPEGGHPYTSRPDSIVFFARYNIEVGDTALVLSMFKSSGQIINFQTYPIVGNSNGIFLRHSFPIVYSSGSTPDTILLGAVNTNVFNESNFFPASILAVDNIQLVGGTDSIYNWNFEHWVVDTTDFPQHWNTIENSEPSNQIFDRINKSADRVSGQYAIRLANDGGSRSAAISSGPQNGPPLPNFPVQVKYSTFNCFLKFSPTSNDTLRVNATMFKNGVALGGAYLQIDTLVSDYTPFELPVYYNDTSSIPDSASVNVWMGKMNATGFSIAFLDNLSFDGFRPTTTAISRLQQFRNIFCHVYPNPTSNVLQLSYINSTHGTAQYEIYNLTGACLLSHKQVAHPGLTKQEINIEGLSDGTYIIKVKSSSTEFTRKFIVKK